MNRLLISGHLTQDPQVKYGKAKNTPYCTLNIINKDCRKDVRLDVKVFGSDAELSSQFLAKARQVEVEARIEKDSKTGENIFVSDKVIFGDKPKEEEVVLTDENF